MSSPVIEEITVKVVGTLTISIVRPNSPPEWQQNVVLDADSGVPKQWNVLDFVTDKDGDALVLALVQISEQLQAVGVSFDPQTNILRYDGTPIPPLPEGSDALVGTVQFSADDGR